MVAPVAAFTLRSARNFSLIGGNKGKGGTRQINCLLALHPTCQKIKSLSLIHIFTIQKAYLKPFNPEILKNMEKNKWGLDIVYKETVEALEKQNIPIVSDLPDEPFTCLLYTSRCV